jgi:hypothetical protein
MTLTLSATSTTTMTEARVRAVMQKVAANFNAFVAAQYVTREQADKWAADLTYLQVEEAIEFFEVQLTTPAGVRLGLRYTVSWDGSLQQDSGSGGLSVYGLPAGTRAGLVAHLRSNAKPYIWAELAKRGWGFNGIQLEGSTADQRAFSREGYGIVREAVGVWST